MKIQNLIHSSTRAQCCVFLHLVRGSVIKKCIPINLGNMKGKLVKQGTTLCLHPPHTKWEHAKTILDNVMETCNMHTKWVEM